MGKSYPGFPSGAFTTDDEKTLRLRVDVGQTGFFAAREFRASLDATVARTIKFTSPVDFILELQTLQSHSGEATLTAWGASQGVATGDFTKAVNVLPNNGMASAPVYVRQSTVTTNETGGGVFTPNGGEVAREFIKVKAATATAQISTVGGAAVAERGLPAGTYYLQFTGSDYSYRLIYEERP